MTRLFKWSVATLSLMTLVMTTGCTNNLVKNVWVGFGESIGALPGSIAANFVAGLLGVDTN